MAKITIEELSKSLKDYLNGLGLTEAQVQELIDKFEDEKIGDISQLSTEEKGNIVGAINEIKNNIDSKDLSDYQEKTDDELVTTDKTIVGAINELFQSANNGKELIASAIGEPLSSEDTFSAMSNDINGLLSTFKTNMMNNGVTVESSDKFKVLIDKIATLADNEGKGMQYASGQISAPQRYTFANTSTTHTFNFGEPLNFTPTYLFIRIPDVRYSSANGSGEAINAIVSNLFNDIYEGNDWANQFRVGCVSSEGVLNIKSVSTTGFVMEGDTDITFGCATSSDYYGTDEVIDWYAIGVGEEDTTLRDSLASILTEEGVSVTEEDDMASLISKVDEEFDRQVLPAGTAVASNVLSGKTFINSTGQTITGTMANRGGAQTVTPGTSNKTLNAGYYSGNITVQGDSNLKPENIVSGASIFGVSGNALTVTPASSSTASKKLIDIYYLDETTRVGSTFDELNEMVVINRNELGFTGYSKLYAKMTGTIISTSPSSNSFYVRVLSSSWSLNESFNKNYVGELPIDIEFELRSTDDITISGDSGSFADGLYLYIKDLKISIYYV